MYKLLDCNNKQTEKVKIRKSIDFTKAKFNNTLF